MATDAIGGYFGLEPDDGPETPWPWPGAQGYQSARAAFLALLQAHRPKAVWLPWFLCDAMAEPLSQLGISARRYALDDEFRPPSDLAVLAGEWLLYVNLFGLNDDVSAGLLTTYGRDAVVLDHAQALYSPPGGLATLYSPRKFVGVPDGGLLVTDLAMPMPGAADEAASRRRAMAGLQRLTHGAEAGYDAFRRAERSLSMQAPTGMSAFTRQRLLRIDHASLTALRRRNFEHLHDALKAHNRLSVALAPGQVPMAYPFWPRHQLSRAQLQRDRVYVPTLWPELLVPGSDVPAQERLWAREWLALPVDQRLDIDTLTRRVIDPVLKTQVSTRQP